MLLSLHILLDTLAPAEDAPSVGALLSAITGEPVLLRSDRRSADLGGPFQRCRRPARHVACLLAFRDPRGGAGARPWRLISAARSTRCWKAAASANAASRRVPLGNLINRLVGVALALPFLQPIADLFARFDPNAARMTADFHTAFNVVLAVAFVFALDGVAALLKKLLPEPAKRADPSAPLYLDETAIDTPSVALACAARETLHMGDVVEDMLRKAMTALMTNDRKLTARSLAHGQHRRSTGRGDKALRNEDNPWQP